MYERRKYRDWISPAGLVSFGVTVRETDLWICAERPIKNEAQVHVFKIRGYIESYIRDYPGFLKVLAPWVIEGPAPEIVREMAEAGVRAGVGPWRQWPARWRNPWAGSCCDFQGKSSWKTAVIFLCS